MNFTEHLLFAVLLMPTAAVVLAAALTLAAPRPEVSIPSVAEFPHIEVRP